MASNEEVVIAHATRANLGFLLAKASQRWNELLYHAFRQAGYADIRPAFGSVLLPLFEEDGLQMGELARRAQLSKQTMTTFVRTLEERGLVMRAPDPADRRAYRIVLTDRAREFRVVAETALHELDQAVAALLTPAEVHNLKQALLTLIQLQPPVTPKEEYRESRHEDDHH